MQILKIFWGKLKEEWPGAQWGKEMVEQRFER